MSTRPPRRYGLLGEFDSAAALLHAIERARASGYRRLDAYTPYPVPHLAEALGYGPSPMPVLVFLGGLVGALGGFFLQWWICTVDYPINVGGRPLNSWPAFIPITFEMTVLIGGLTALFGMLAINGLPHPYHPLFDVPRFAQGASRDRFFLDIDALDPHFEPQATRAFLLGVGASEVSDVEM